MNFLSLLLSIFVSSLVYAQHGSEGVGGSNMSTITIDGLAANYLYKNFAGKLNFVTCKRQVVLPLHSSPQPVCVLEVYGVTENNSGLPVIDGFAAKELYMTLANTPSFQSGIRCYISQFGANGNRKYACELNARVIASEGL